jgi:predicted Zn-dependent peptidase
MNYFRKIVFLLVFCAVSANLTFAQTVIQPRQEKLLNGLKILIFPDAKAEKVSLRLRVHSGSAFDPKDKMGVMALLAESLFPDEQTKTFFREDLQGSLEVTSNYDYIQINASAKPDEFLTILETVATAVSNPPLTPENFTKVRDARLKKVEELQKNPAYLADMAVAKRLLGEFPYGRPADGTPESLKLIDRPDLIFAKERFFTSDNATLAISGNVKPDFAYMAARRLFGAWKKSDKLVPATFRQPDAPVSAILQTDSTDESRSHLRFAARGLARNDKDFWALKILTNALNKRDVKGFMHEARLLPGIFIFGAPGDEIKIETGKEQFVFESLLTPPVKAEEFAAAKSEVLNEIIQKNPADHWLDVDTYKLASVKADLQAAQNVTPEDVQRVYEQLKKSPKATVLMLKKTVAATPAN